MKPFNSGTISLCFIFTFLFMYFPKISACTIVSAIAKNGHVWNANNEDGPLGIANFINVYPKIEENSYGYYTLTYLSPKYGQTGNVQGGANEAGLTFDFNAIDPVHTSYAKNKKIFPKGDDAILVHILSTMATVDEVITFFDTYWFENGFKSAQMHVADKTGTFAILSPSGIQKVANGSPLVTTNFDICGKEDGTSCWRYPIATAKIEEEGASFKTMQAILVETKQKNGATMYSNIQNLTTGQIWFFSKHDPGTTVEITIEELLEKGRNSFSFSNLNALTENKIEKKYYEPFASSLTDKELDEHVGNFKNWFLGTITISKNETGLIATFPDGFKTPLVPSGNNSFFVPQENVVVQFSTDPNNNKKTLALYENEFWSFTAWEDLE